SLNDPSINIASLGTSRNQCPPPGVAMSGRYMVDETHALNSTLNPANVWRAAHPYDSWPAFISNGVGESPPADLNSCGPNAPLATIRSAPEVQPNPAAAHAPVSAVPRKDTPTTASQTVRRPVLPSQRVFGPIDPLQPVPGSVDPAQTVPEPLSEPLSEP